MTKYLKTYWLSTLLAPIFMIGEVLMDLVQPQLMSTIVDEGVLGISTGGVGNMELVIWTGLKMIGLVAIGGVFGILSGVFANLCGQRFGNDIRKDCFKKVMSLSFEQTDKFSTGSLVTRVTNDVTQVQNLVLMSVRGFVRTFMLFAGGIVCLISLDLSFGIIVACALPLVLLCMIFFILKANPFFGMLQQKLDTVNSVVQETVGGARTIKAYVREEHEKTRFDAANGELVGTQLKVLVLFSYMMPLMNIMMNLLVVAIIYMGAIRMESGGMTPGSIMAAITYISQILHSVIMLSGIFQTISRGVASARRLQEILDCEPVIQGGTKLPQESTQGKVEFKNVTFAYPGGSGRQVLSGINLTINPGETLGILGATGSGKSSLISLIPRFYDAVEGQVLVDGVDVRELPLPILREKVAVALQKSELFSGTIGENILWGRPGATQQEVEKAAESAQASEFINGREEGFDTKVAEQGTSLSGGQKQRLSISRAILKNAEILIFDDSTSALDLKTESSIYSALRLEYKGMTKIIIAQRIASVKNADRIAVIDGGKIAACGSHSQLMAESSIYRDIYNSQLKSGGDENAS